MYFKERKKEIITMLVVTVLCASLIPVGLTVGQDGGGGSFKSHHKVLAEYGTTTTCPYCPSMATYIAQVTGDFQYIALVADKNGYASARCGELGISGVPHALFDGGYRSVLGGQSSVTNLQNAYNDCQQRTVADVDVTATGIWNTDAQTMKITVTVDNFGGSTYNGKLRIYVIEKVSRWMQYGGTTPYKNALLYYTPISVSIGAGDSLTNVINQWSDPQGLATKDNLRVVAAVFSQSNDYVDECAIADPTTGGGDDDDDDDDDVILPRVRITEPYEGAVVNGTITISGTADNPGGTGLAWVLVKIDEGSWKKAKGTSSWCYTWDTTTVDDGEHTISAISSDGALESGLKTVTVKVKNNEDPEEEDPIPELACNGNLKWTGIKAGITVYGEFTVENVGEPNSNLSWAITESPVWVHGYFQKTREITLNLKTELKRLLLL